MDYKKLLNDLRKAQLKALMFATYDDGGTCNFDSPMLCVKGTSEETLRKHLNGEFDVWKHSTGVYCIATNCCHGQGYRRTKMAETIAESLRNDGWECYVYYQMD